MYMRSLFVKVVTP